MVVTIITLVGKLFICGAYSTLYAITGEYFPTMIRNQAIGACSFNSRISGIAAPYLFYLGKCIYVCI